MAEDPETYSSWVQHREETRPPIPEGGSLSRTLHLVMVIAGEPPSETMPTLESLQKQRSGHWALTVFVHSSWRTTFTSLLAVSGMQRPSQRVHVESADDESTEHQMLFQAFRLRPESDISLIFPGDVWAHDAVTLLSEALDPRAVVYADQDCLTARGSYESPLLKPEYSPEFHLRSSFVGRPIAIGSKVVRLLSTTLLRESSSVEHNVALLACELADRVEHIPEVLCHRLIPPPADTPDFDHVIDTLARRHDPADVCRGLATDTFRVRRTAPPSLKTSIIIPFRDEPQLLRTCVDSIEATRSGMTIEYVLIDNGSVEPETATLLDLLRQRANTRIVSDGRPFNWAQLNNAASKVATGEVLVFLNNDIEAHDIGWLGALCSQAMRPGVGAVGARLLYPDRRLQHCGVVIGLGGAAGHLFVGLEEDQHGYLRMATTTRECGAVTGACLATRTEVFFQLGGFDESLGVDLNDIDYCLRAQRQGFSVLYEADAELIHHESPSRGTAGDVRDIVHFIDRWKESILSCDPYLNPNLTRVDSSCALRRSDEEVWWNKWNESLSR